MGQVSCTVPAERDLTDIWLYIAEDNMEAADTFVDRVHSVFKKLADVPAMGRIRPELGVRVRSFGTGSYTILYLPVEGGIEVLRVVHGARDFDTLD